MADPNDVLDQAMGSGDDSTTPEPDVAPRDGGQGVEGSAADMLDRLGFKSEDALGDSLKNAQRKITELSEQQARLAEDYEGLLGTVQATPRQRETHTVVEDDLGDLGLGDDDLDLGLGGGVKKLRKEVTDEIGKLRGEIGGVFGQIQITLLEALDPAEFKPEYMKGVEIEAKRAPHLLQQGMPGIRVLYGRAKKGMQKVSSERAVGASKLTREALEEIGVDVDSLPMRKGDGGAVTTSPKPGRPGERTVSVSDPKQKALRGAQKLVGEKAGIDAVLEAHWAGRPE